MNYLWGFILTILLVLLTGLCILKISVLNKNYVKKELNNTNYYDTVYDEIYEEMASYMVSSGLPEDILKDLFTKEEVTRDINQYIDNLYNNKNEKLDIQIIKDRLARNIDDYVKNNNIVISKKSNLDSFINEIGNIYKNEINLYNTLDSLNNYIVKINKIVNILVIVLSIITIIMIFMMLLKRYRISSSFMAGGLILLFIKFVVYNKVDYNNLLIVSIYFSKVLRNMLKYVSSLLLGTGLILIVIGLGLTLIKSFKSIEKKGKNLYNY